ncbi:hypothetical protein AQ810_17145 [Burkholderia pseudomallei]|nr:hypothetical protein AQ810_17145 [Burkholderia pseudomallei]
MPSARTELLRSFGQHLPPTVPLTTPFAVPAASPTVSGTKVESYRTTGLPFARTVDDVIWLLPRLAVTGYGTGGVLLPIGVLHTSGIIDMMIHWPSWRAITLSAM